MFSLTFLWKDHNPVPYKRTTQRQKYVDEDYKKYQQWKAIVYFSFIKQLGKAPQNFFKKDQKYYVDIMIYFKDRTHGDSDNIMKGVLDAIFQKPLTDKYIAGSFDYQYDKKNPRVEVKISENRIINDEKRSTF